MPKTAIIVTTATVLGIALIFFMFGRDSAEQTPITDPQCEPGYELVGEGCIPAKEACELGGDQYYYDEPQQKCLMR